MLAFPSLFTSNKMILMGFLSITVVFDIIINRLRIKRNVLLAVIVTISVGLAYILYGYINVGHLDLKLIEMYVLTPFISYLFSFIIKSEKEMNFFFNILMFITLFIVVYDAIYMLGRFGIMPQWLTIETDIAGSYIMNSNKVEMRITNQSSLMFLLPMMISNFFFYKEKEKVFVYIKITIIILGIITTLVSGRRALQLVVGMSFVFVFLFKKIFRISDTISLKKIKNIVVFLIVCLLSASILDKVITSIYGIENIFESVKATFLQAFDKTSRGGQLRNMQSIYLVKTWAENPLFGHGIGNYVKEFTRSEKSPWSYEMVYLALLFQTGIFGVLFYFGLVLEIIKLIFIKSKQNKENGKIFAIFLSILIGFICFFIAGASNPLIFYIWAWVIVMTVINYRKK